jgi:2-keto-4-pentenoate hydratase/2-oxohepta-3-ene-1,7-dioic acid hydratase in catechol pathway
MHYECELAVVIGKTARNVKRDDAYDFVGGYTVANDYAIRDYLENWYRPNLRVKNRDTCTPLGPWLVDAADVPNPMALALQTTVNGKVTQSGNTRDMIFDVPFLIEYFSSFMTLQPGDLILTGTPDGVVDCQPATSSSPRLKAWATSSTPLTSQSTRSIRTTMQINHLINGKSVPARELFRNRQPRHAGGAGRGGLGRRGRSQRRRGRRQGRLPQMGRHMPAPSAPS